MLIRPGLRPLLGALIVSVTAAACGGKPSSRTMGGGTEPTTAAGDSSCPVAVSGTSVTVEDADSGAALVFVTSGDAGDVRRRAGAMAKMHNDHHGSMGALPDGSAGGGHEGHDMSGGDGHGETDMKAAGAHAGHDMSGGHAHAGHDMSGGGGHAGHTSMVTIHSRVTVQEVPNGARLVFVANGDDVAKLQTELRSHAQHMASGTCAMSK